VLVARYGVLVACDLCSWLGMGCCWVETRGWGPKTGLGGSERVLVGRGGALVGLNAVLWVERGCRWVWWVQNGWWWVEMRGRGSKRELGCCKLRLGVEIRVWGVETRG
jgi:hypothetical protein